MQRARCRWLWVIMVGLVTAQDSRGDYGEKWHRSFEGAFQPSAGTPGPARIFFRTNDQTLIVSAARLIGLNSSGNTRWNHPIPEGWIVGLNGTGGLTTVRFKVNGVERFPVPRFCENLYCLRSFVETYNHSEEGILKIQSIGFADWEPLRHEGQAPRIYLSSVGRNGELFLMTGTGPAGPDLLFTLDSKGQFVESRYFLDMDYGGLKVAIAQDTSGSPIVTGRYSDYRTGQAWTHITTGLPIGYDLPLGTEQDFVPWAMQINKFGDILIAGGGGDIPGVGVLNYGGPFKVVSYREGRSSWVQTMASSNKSSGCAFALATDEAGAAYVTGSVVISVNNAPGGGPTSELVTIKYSRDGVPIWTNSIPSDQHLAGQPSVLLLDPQGEVTIAGTSFGGGDDFGYLVARVATDGRLLWSKRFPGSVRLPGGGRPQLPSPLLIDGIEGGHFLSLLRRNPVTGQHVTDLISLSREGHTLWQQSFPAAFNAGGLRAVVTGDGEGNSYVSGYEAGGGSNWMSLKVNLGGIPLWTNRSAALADAQDFMTVLAATSSGDVWALARTLPIMDEVVTGYILRKINPEGFSSWEVRVVDSRERVPISLALDETGSAIVAARLSEGGRLKGIELTRFSADGLAIWKNELTTDIGNLAGSVHVAVGSDAVIVSAALSNVTHSLPDVKAVLFGLGANGVYRWTDPLDDVPSSVMINQQSHAYVSYSKRTTSPAPTLCFTTVKYDPEHRPVWTNRLERLEGDLGAENLLDRNLIQDPRGNVMVVTDEAERRLLRESHLCPPFDLRRSASLQPVLSSKGIGSVPEQRWMHGTRDGVFASSRDRSTLHGAYMDWRLTWLRDFPTVERRSTGTRIGITLFPSSQYRVDRGGTPGGPWKEVGTSETDFLGDAEFIDSATPEGNTFYRFSLLGEATP